MAALPFQLDLGERTRRRVWAVLILVNLLLSLTTTAFIVLWSRMDTLAPDARWWVRYVLVQGHLATENVLAAWYSSMLLLAVGGLSLLAWAVDRRRGTGALRVGWVGLAAIFAALSLDEIGSLHERIGMMPLISPTAIGWVYLLTVPILATGALMGAFALLHVRRVPRAAGLMAAGIAAFLMNPAIEAVEMHLIHGSGATPGTWSRHLHDVLLVVEEGGLELFGITAFVAAVTVYLARTEGEIVEGPIDQHTARLAAGITTLMLGAGIFASDWLVARLPGGDSGIARNWFPAAAWLVVCVVAVADAGLSRPVARTAAGLALAFSAMAGAGLYGYIPWVTSRAAWFAPLACTLAAGLALEVLLGNYFFTRSPRSSIASPTLRRPRPNPS